MLKEKTIKQHSLSNRTVLQKNEGDIKKARDKQKTKECLTTESAFKEMLKGSVSGWHKRRLDSNFKPYKILKN